MALTRARHCLWVIGNETTLALSGSIRAKLISESRRRGCFHDAADEKNLRDVINEAMLEDVSSSFGSLSIGNGRRNVWYIFFIFSTKTHYVVQTIFLWYFLFRIHSKNLDYF